MSDPCPSITNYWGFPQYDGQCEFFGDSTAVSQAVGWLIVVGFGTLFALGTSIMVWADSRFGSEPYSATHFSTAGRSIKVGLTACDIVSKWTWAATLLQSSNVAWKFGVSGPFWYASGATVQVLLFSILAIELKRKAPQAHTVLELIKCRWGTVAHLVFMFFCFATSLIVTSMLILGGASVVEALSGVNVYAGAFLIPMGVTIYTAHGGLKATFIASWSHVAVLYIALCIFMFKVYAGPEYTSPTFGVATSGSPGNIWDSLDAISRVHPVAGNKGGSYLTFFSKDGVIFGIINIIGNFGTVFVDQAYWQSAIAAKPSATYKGYMLGGLCWFAIPFSMATTMGLGARALDLPITLEEANAGLVPPALAVFLMGGGGGFLLVFMLFMAVTASGSAEQIAVSSLVSYDIYYAYINKKASPNSIKIVGRVMVFVYGIISGAVAIILLKIGLSLGWVYLFMGVMVGSAVPPIAMCVTWKGCSAAGAIAGAVCGQLGALTTWIVVAAVQSDSVTVDTLGMDNPMLAGNVVAIGLSAVVCTVVSLIKPQNFDWKEFDSIPMPEFDPTAALPEEGKDSEAALTKALKWTYLVGGTLTVVLLIAWPLLALIPGIFSKGYFYFWIIIAFIWGILASLACVLLPIFEAKDTIVSITKAVVTCTPPPRKGSDLPVENPVKDADPSTKSMKSDAIKSEEEADTTSP